MLLSLLPARCIIERIEQIGASFRSLTEAIDATTPAGRWLCTWSGAVRSLRGLGSASGRRPAAAARTQGRVGARRPKRREAQQTDMVTMATSGQKNAAAAARLFGVYSSTVSRLLAAHRVHQGPTEPKEDHDAASLC